MLRTRTISFLTATCLLATACAGSDDASSSVPETDAPVETEAPADTEAPVETEAPADTEAPVETEAPTDTEAPVETEAPAELPTETQPITVQPRGTDALVSTQSFDDTVAAAVAGVEGFGDLVLVATIDHSANAAAAGVELPPTTELVFGSPATGTPLMQAEPTIGIDLPLKMLIVEDLDGTVAVSWNRTDYLASRHGLSLAVDEQVQAIANASSSLGAIAASVAADVEPTESVTVVGEREGLIETEAAGTAREAADRLLTAISEDPELVLVAEIDHAAAAADAGLELSPVIEVLFANPTLDTPLLQASRSIGIDLPWKMLFIEDGDSVRIVHNDPDFIAKRHKIDRDVALLVAISDALAGLADTAAG